MLDKIRLAAVLVILTFIPLLLAACVTEGNPTLPAVVSTSLSPTKTFSQEDPKPTPDKDSLSPVRTTPIIIATSTPNVDQHPQNTSTPLSSPISTENRLVAQAKEDLSERLSVPLEEIELLSMEEVTWRDGSLGCPKPGMAYTQALVNGTLIVLSVDERQYRYHSGRGRAPFLCENKPDLLPQLDLGND